MGYSVTEAVLLSDVNGLVTWRRCNALWSQRAVGNLKASVCCCVVHNLLHPSNQNSLCSFSSNSSCAWAVLEWFCGSKPAMIICPKVANNIEVVFLQVRRSWCFHPGKALSFPHLLTLQSSHVYEKHLPSNHHYLIFRSSHFSVTRLLSLGTLPAKYISMPQFPAWITTQTLARLLLHRKCSSFTLAVTLRAVYMTEILTLLLWLASCR